MTLPIPAMLRRLTTTVMGLVIVGVATQAPTAPAGKSDTLAARGKPIPPLAMRYEVSGDAILGQTMTVTVSITPEQPLDNATVRLSADAALLLAAPPGGLEFGNVAAGREIRVVIGVTPLALTVSRLNVSVAGLMHGQAQSRNLSIPIRLGAVAKTPAVLKLDAGGQVIHSLPTQGAPRGTRR